MSTTPFHQPNNIKQEIEDNDIKPCPTNSNVAIRIKSDPEQETNNTTSTTKCLKDTKIKPDPEKQSTSNCSNGINIIKIPSSCEVKTEVYIAL